MHVGNVYSPNVNAPSPARELGAPAPRPASAGVPFSQLMSQALQDADQQQQVVNHGLNQLATGELDNIHDVAIQVAQADISFRIVMEVRDQLISAYQEVMRMQV